MENNNSRKIEVPIWHKANLSIDEAVAYSGIGRAKLYEMTNREDCPFVLWIGNRRVVKREAFDEYIRPCLKNMCDLYYLNKMAIAPM